jgi:hypothetical protein
MGLTDLFNNFIMCLGCTVFLLCVCSCLSAYSSSPDNKSSITIIAIPENSNLQDKPLMKLQLSSNKDENSKNLKVSSSINANLQTQDENKLNIKLSDPEAFNSISF